MFSFIRLLLLLAVSGSAAAQSFSATYQPVPQIRDHELRQLQIDWRKHGLLESLSEELSRKFTLNQPLRIALGECGLSNAFYSRDERVIVICLELIPDLVNRFSRLRGQHSDRPALLRAVSGALVFVVFHELGHALIDVQQLPVLGREEDAADKISTFLILQDPMLPDAVIEGALLFFYPKQLKLIPNFFSQRHLSDEHSLDPQRAVDLACAAYGKDPQRYLWAAQAAKVTPQRAERCADEYAQLDRSVRSLLRGAMR